MSLFYIYIKIKLSHSFLKWPNFKLADGAVLNERIIHIVFNTEVSIFP